MTVTLQEFAVGDRDYIPKLNGNFRTLGDLLDALNNLLAGQIAAAGGPGAGYTALFGTGVSVIGASSYAATGSGSTLTVAGGYCWRPSLATVVSKGTSTALSFAGQVAATYYVQVDSTGAPSRSDETTEALYSVEWTGSAFGAITRLAAVVWGAADHTLAQTSTALGASYTTMDARMEAGEAAAVAGQLARTWQTGRLSKSVAGGVDVTLTDAEANNTILHFTGTLTADIAVIVPLGIKPRLWVVTNNTTGSFTVTVKGATGTGIVVVQGGTPNLLMQDGTNVTRAVSLASLGGAVSSVNGATGAVTLDAGDIDITDAGAQFVAVDVEGALQELASGLDTVAGVAAGAGDVDGPAGATDGHVVLFDGSTGKVIKSGGTPAAHQAGTVAGVSAKTTPADADLFALVDSEDSNALKKITWANVKARLKTYFDTLYAPKAQAFDVQGFYPGVPPTNALYIRIPVGRAVDFAASFAGSVAVSRVAATASHVITVAKNGAAIGTITFAAGATTGTFASTGGAAQSLAAGDILSITGPGTADATLADVGYVLVGVR